MGNVWWKTVIGGEWKRRRGTREEDEEDEDG